MNGTEHDHCGSIHGKVGGGLRTSCFSGRPAMGGSRWPKLNGVFGVACVLCACDTRHEKHGAATLFFSTSYLTLRNHNNSKQYQLVSINTTCTVYRYKLFVRLKRLLLALLCILLETYV